MMPIVGVTGLAGSGKSTVAQIIAPRHLVRVGYDLWHPIRNEAGVAFKPLRTRAVEMGLADPLKVFAGDVFDWSDDVLWGDSDRRNLPDKRYLHAARGSRGTTMRAGPRSTSILGIVARRSAEWRASALEEHGGETGTLVVSEPTLNPPEDEYLTPRRALQLLGTEWGRTCWPDVWVERLLRDARRLLGAVRIEARGPTWAIESADLIVVPDVRYQNEIDCIRRAGGEVWRIVRPDVKANGHSAHSSESGQNELSVDRTIDNSGTLLNLREQVAACLQEAGL